MRPMLSLITALLACAGAAQAQEIDWKKVDDALGRPGAVSGDVHRYGFPRSDLQVTLDGVAIKPGFALGGWVAFKPMHGAGACIAASKRRRRSCARARYWGSVSSSVRRARLSRRQVSILPICCVTTRWPTAMHSRSGRRSWSMHHAPRGSSTSWATKRSWSAGTTDRL